MNILMAMTVGILFTCMAISFLALLFFLVLMGRIFWYEWKDIKLKSASR